MIIKCSDCSAVFERLSNGHKRCINCARLATNRRAREHHKSTYKPKDAVGGTCAECGATIIITSPRKRYCPACAAASLAAYHKEYNKAYVEQRQQVSIRYRARNPEKCKQRAARYRERHRDKLLAHNKTDGRRATVKRYEQRKSTDLCFKLSKRISHQIWLSLREEKSGRRWELLVGYTSQELRRHIERQFLRGMSWDNFGEWHIDHIVPIRTFNFSSPDDGDFAACWALTNLRPLWAVENMRKGGRRLHLL